MTTRALCSSWVSVLALQTALLLLPDRPFHITSWLRRFALRAEECSALQLAARSLLYNFPFDSIRPFMSLPASTVMFLGYEQIHPILLSQPCPTIYFLVASSLVGWLALGFGPPV